MNSSLQTFDEKTSMNWISVSEEMFAKGFGVYLVSKHLSPPISVCGLDLNISIKMLLIRTV